MFFLIKDEKYMVRYMVNKKCLNFYTLKTQLVVCCKSMRNMNILLWKNNFSSQVWGLKTKNLLRLQWYQLVVHRPNKFRKTTRHLRWRDCQHSIQGSTDTLIRKDGWEMGFVFFIFVSKFFLICFLKDTFFFSLGGILFQYVLAPHWVKVFSNYLPDFS